MRNKVMFDTIGVQGAVDEAEDTPYHGMHRVEAPLVLWAPRRTGAPGESTRRKGMGKA